MKHDRLHVIHTVDGRTILRLDTGAKESAWLELSAEDRRWLIEALRQNPWDQKPPQGEHQESVAWAQ